MEASTDTKLAFFLLRSDYLDEIKHAQGVVGTGDEWEFPITRRRDPRCVIVMWQMHKK